MNPVADIRAMWPRTGLVSHASPVHRLERLERWLGGGVEIYIKRDDLLRPFCGNKLRYIEYVLGAYRAGKHDCIVHCGEMTSNFLMQLAIIGAQEGVPVHVLLRGDHPPVWQGNILLEDIFGACISYRGAESKQSCSDIKRQYAQKLRSHGHDPFVIDYPLSNYIGILGNLGTYEELHIQIKKGDLPEIDHIVMCSAGNSYLGLRVASHLYGDMRRITAFPPIRFSDSGLGSVAADRRMFLLKKIREFADATERELDIATVEFDEGFVGDGYGVPTSESIEAVRILASMEGVLLDPIYTGKAMAGLISYIRRGAVTPGTRILFIHTGGWVNVFTFNNAFAEYKHSNPLN